MKITAASDRATRIEAFNEAVRRSPSTSPVRRADLDRRGLAEAAELSEQVSRLAEVAENTPVSRRVEKADSFVRGVEQCIDAAAGYGAIAAQPLAATAALLRQPMALRQYEMLQARLIRAIYEMPAESQCKLLHTAIRHAVAYEDLDNSALCESALQMALRDPVGDHLLPVFENFVIISPHNYMRLYDIARTQAMFRPADTHSRVRAALTRSLQLVKEPLREELFDEQRAYADVLRRRKSSVADLDAALAHVGTKLAVKPQVRELLFDTFAHFALEPHRIVNTECIADLCRGATALNDGKKVDAFIERIEARMLRGYSERSAVYGGVLPLIWKTTPAFRRELLPRLCAALRIDTAEDAFIVTSQLVARFSDIDADMRANILSHVVRSLGTGMTDEAAHVSRHLPNLVGTLPGAEAARILREIQNHLGHRLHTYQAPHPREVRTRAQVREACTKLEAALSIASTRSEARAAGMYQREKSPVHSCNA